MKTKNLLVSVALALFFAACSDDATPGVNDSNLGFDESSSSTEIIYSTDSDGNLVVVSGSSAASGEQNPTGIPSSNSQGAPQTENSSNSNSNPSSTSVTPAAEITSAPSASKPTGKVNFPFPQNVTYSNGIVVSDQSVAATNLKSTFDNYLKNKYMESGNYAAIAKESGGSQFVSEGTGYGMLMMVYFSDNTRSYQDEFDKLWAYYKAGSNEHGLMNWSFGSLAPYDNKANAATDAEMDVAAALIMAAYQFGDDKYLDEVRTLLGNVRKYEFEEGGVHKPGDAWNDKKNPSYAAPAYFRLFAAVSESQDDKKFWSETAMNANYTLLETNSAEYTTGLFDNWSDASGKGLDSYYGYDAARTPWRLAQDFLWHGETKAKTMLYKLGTWVSGYKASEMKGTIHRSGSPMWYDHNSTFVATLMTSLVTDATRQNKLDEYWTEVVKLGNEAYFEQSMKILCGLLVTGNMPNLMALAAGQN